MTLVKMKGLCNTCSQSEVTGAQCAAEARAEWRVTLQLGVCPSPLPCTVSYSSISVLPFRHRFPFSLLRAATYRRLLQTMYVHQCQNCQQLFFTDSNSKTALSHSTLSSLLCTMYLLCAGVLVVVARYVDGRMLLFKFQYPIIQHNAQHFNLHISVTFGKIECRVRFK